MKRIKPYTLKIPYGTGATKVKLEASRDITEECGNCDSIFSKNYIFQENLILCLAEIPEEIISI